MRLLDVMLFAWCQRSGSAAAASPSASRETTATAIVAFTSDGDIKRTNTTTRRWSLKDRFCSPAAYVIVYVTLFFGVFPVCYLSDIFLRIVFYLYLLFVSRSNRCSVPHRTVNCTATLSRRRGVDDQRRVEN